jgi:hypothetical protein
MNRQQILILSLILVNLRIYTVSDQLYKQVLKLFTSFIFPTFGTLNGQITIETHDAT